MRGDEHGCARGVQGRCVVFGFDRERPPMPAHALRSGRDDDDGVTRQRRGGHACNQNGVHARAERRSVSGIWQVAPHKRRAARVCGLGGIRTRPLVVAPARSNDEGGLRTRRGGVAPALPRVDAEIQLRKRSTAGRAGRPGPVAVPGDRRCRAVRVRAAGPGAGAGGFCVAGVLIASHPGARLRPCSWARSRHGALFAIGCGSLEGAIPTGTSDLSSVCSSLTFATGMSA